MTPGQVERIVQLVVAADGRTTGTADAIVWTAALHDVAYDDAEHAVLEHVRDGDGWLTAGKVRAGARAAARRRAGLARQAELGGPPGRCGVPGCRCDDVPVLEQAPRRLAIEQAVAGTFRAVPQVDAP